MSVCYSLLADVSYRRIQPREDAFMGRNRIPGARLSDALRRREFRYLFLGVTVSRCGDAMTAVVISWLALRAGGPQAVGLVALAGGVVGAVAAPVAGYLMDRLGLRALMLADSLGRGILMAALASLAWSGTVRTGLLIAFAIAAAVLAPATEVGQNVAAPTLVRPGELDAASRLLSGSWSVSASLGPALAGLAMGALGAGPVLLIDATTFFVMAPVALLLPGRPQNAGRDNQADPGLPGLAGLLSGFLLLWRMRVVAALSVVSVGVLFLDGMTEVFLPAFTRLILHQGPAQYGLLVSVAGLASLGGTALLAPLAGRLGPGPGLGVLLAARAALVLPLAFAGSWLAGAVVIALASLPDGAVYPILAAAQQRLIPAAVRGRVQGARGALGSAGFPLGSALGGTLAAGAGPATLAIVMAAGYLPLAAVAALAWRLPPSAGQRSADPAGASRRGDHAGDGRGPALAAEPPGDCGPDAQLALGRDQHDD
jgi:MFS family permease